MPTFNDIARKAVGDFSDEFPEAGYRAIASNLANSFVTILNEAAKKQQKAGEESLLDNQFIQIFEEPVVSFVLAFLIELLPSETLLPEQRQRVAYNLRVHAYQGLDDKVLKRLRSIIEPLVSEAVTVMTVAIADRAPLLRPGKQKARQRNKKVSQVGRPVTANLEP
jgi:hypothetical protein